MISEEIVLRLTTSDNRLFLGELVRFVEKVRKQSADLKTVVFVHETGLTFSATRGVSQNEQERSAVDQQGR